MVTVALRKVTLSLPGNARVKSITDYIDTDKITLLPNTSGAYSAHEALRIARLAASMSMTHLKIEVMKETKTLLPDVVETIKAVELIKKEFSSDRLFLMVYTNDDPITALKLLEAGADAIMPAGSPIGSGRGIVNRQNFEMIIELINGRVPLVLDAGIGTPSDVVIAMEMGLDAVLLNTAIAGASNPQQMAAAFRLAWQAGRLAWLSGRIPEKKYATASSPLN